MQRRQFAGLALATGMGLAARRPARAATALQFWHVFNLETDVYTRQGVSSFNAAHPDTPLEERIIPFAQYRTELVRAIATGDVPDVVCVDNPDTASFASQDGLLDLSDYLEESQTIKRDVFLPGPWSTVMWRDAVYGIPRDSNTIAVYVNRDMMREAGLDPDAPPATWSELAAAAEKMTSAEKRIVGLLFSARQAEDSIFQWLPFLWQAGGDIDRLDGPEAAEALAYWARFLERGHTSPDVLNMTQSECANRFMAGNAAMAISGPWDTPRVQAGAKFDWALAPMPVHDEKKIRASGLGGWNWCIPAAANYPDEAWQVIEWMTSPQQLPNLWKSGRLPPRTDVAIPDPAYPQAFATYSEQLKSARGRGPHPEWPAISRSIQIAIQKAMTKQATPAEALQAAAAEVVPILEETPL